MGFKPMTSTTKYFASSGTSKKKAFKIQVLMGFKPMTSMTKYFASSGISKEKPFENQALMDSNPTSMKKYFPS
jgi:uncharacterized protein YpmB